MKVLKEQIPKELLERFVRTTGLTGLTDESGFTKTDILLGQFHKLYPELEKFYQPYRAREHLRDAPDGTKAVSILKLLLSSQGLGLSRKMKTVGGLKMVWYNIENPNKHLAGIEVSFN